GPRGPRGQQLSFFVHNTAFVDSEFGFNDARAKLESPFFPFATIQAAIDAAAPLASESRVWQVQIRPGFYPEDVELAAYVNLLGITSQGLAPDLLLAPGGPEVAIVAGDIRDSQINVTDVFLDVTDLGAAYRCCTEWTAAGPDCAGLLFVCCRRSLHGPMPRALRPGGGSQ